MNRVQVTSLRIFIAVMSWLCCTGSSAFSQNLEPSQVLVIYNQAVPESKELAEFYQTARKIPADQVLGLTLPEQQDISRKEYETALQNPLREHFTKNAWWKRGKDKSGIMQPVENRIRAIVLMRGVPLRIKPEPIDAARAKLPAQQQMITTDQASVDSELSLFGVELPSSHGWVQNAFYDSKRTLTKANLPHLVMVNRIDASSHEICKRMISDAVETEKHGLWGRAYIDIGNKFPQGDEWLEKIVSQNLELGIPTLTDRFNETLPHNYPMTEAAAYYGWYERNVDGPFLNPAFKFRPGAIAFHIHSFSAEQLSNPNLNWSAALLSRGAAATVGNVYEPFLHNSHHLSILHDRLIKGWTFAEASNAAIAVHSWQAIALGDPLYRPFIHLEGTGEVRKEDRDFRALRAAVREWPKDEILRLEKLSQAQRSLSSGNIAESLAHQFIAKKDIFNAQIWLKQARESYQESPDKLRQDLQLVAIERSNNQPAKALQLLRSAKTTYNGIPEAEALSKWLEIVQKSSAPTN